MLTSGVICFPYHTRHHPRKRVIQYSRGGGDGIEKPQRTGYPAFAGHDSQRAALAIQGKIPYSAGLASGGGLAGGGVVEACAAAARFSTIRTATIEPS